MNKYLKKTFIGLSIIIGVFLLLLAALSIYVKTNNQFLKDKFSEAIQKRTAGETQIGKISTGFIETFPFLSIKITDLTIRDSAYSRHKKDFLKVEKAFVRISVFRLLSKNKLDRIILENGQINIFRDTFGFDNTYIFKSADKVKDDNETEEASNYPAIHLKNMVLDYEHPDRFKDYHLLARNLLVKIDSKNELLNIKADIDFQIDKIAFNSKRGGFLTNSSFKSNLRLTYNKQSKFLDFVKQTIYINETPFIFGGKFSLDKANWDFTLSIQTNKASYEQITNLLPEKNRAKLSLYKVKGNVEGEALISGKTSSRTDPLVAINFGLKNGTVTSKFFTLNNSEFTGKYSNQVES
ncbi:MAG: AsmA family protein, partial [Flavitalea sp.]